jgi:hypothetical protein
MILEEIELKKDTESKRKAILENIGKQVILYDLHQDLLHGRLLGKVNENAYLIYVADERGHMQFWYEDLQKLFLLKAHKNCSLPRIKIE